MGISVEALETESAPQVGITVSGLNPDSPSVISVEVSWDGGESWHGVRGARQVTVTGGAFFRDFVPPLNVEATYRVLVHSGPGLLPDVRYVWTGTPNVSPSQEIVDGSLSRTNWISNPSFESAVTGVPVGVTVTRAQSADVFAGSWRAVVTGSAGASSCFYTADGSAPVTPGQWVAFSGRVNRASSTPAMRAAVEIQWRAGTTHLSFGPRVYLNLSTSALTSSSAWLRTVHQAPAGADNARAVIRFYGESVTAPPEGFVAHMDGLQLGAGATREEALDQAGVWETTSSGAGYRVETEALAPHGDVTLTIPAGAGSRTGVPLLVYCHGAGGGADHFARNSAWLPLRDWLIGNGWAIVEGTGGGPTSWGNQAARDAYLAYVAHARSRLNVGAIVAMGRSMGGIVASWLAARSPIAADVSALVMNSAVSTIFVGTQAGASVDKSTAAYFASTITEAYGVNGADPDWYTQLQVAAADHAPENWPADVWTGRRILHLYGTADTTVPWHSRGGQYMRDLWAGYPAVDQVYANEGGDHGVPGQYQLVDPVADLLTTLAASVTPPRGVSGAGYFDGDSPEIPPTAETRITIESDRAWIQDPLAPRTAVPIYYESAPFGEVWLAEGSLASATYAQSVDRVVPEGARYPVSSVGQRLAAGDVPLNLGLDVIAEAGRLRNLLATAGQVVLRGLPEGVLDPVAHVTLSDPVETRAGTGTHAIAIWEMEATQERPTSLKVVVPWWTYEDVVALVGEALGAGATYQAVMDASPGTTYVDWLRDPRRVLDL